MTATFNEINTKNRNLAVMCVMGGLLFGLILGTLIIGTLFNFAPSILIAVFTGIGNYIMWAICIVIAVLLTCLIVHYIKKLNAEIKDYKDSVEA